MASRKFKEWAPTPLPLATDVEAKTNANAKELLRAVTTLVRLFVVIGFFLVMILRLASVRMWPALRRRRYSPRENATRSRRRVRAPEAAGMSPTRRASAYLATTSA